MLYLARLLTTINFPFWLDTQDPPDWTTEEGWGRGTNCNKLLTSYNYLNQHLQLGISSMFLAFLLLKQNTKYAHARPGIKIVYGALPPPKKKTAAIFMQ